MVAVLPEFHHDQPAPVPGTKRLREAVIVTLSRVVLVDVCSIRIHHSSHFFSILLLRSYIDLGQTWMLNAPPKKTC